MKTTIVLKYALPILCIGMWYPLLSQTEKPSREDSTVTIPGWRAQAVAIALREFQKKQGGKTDRGEPVYGDLQHYTIAIAQSPPDELPIEYEREECVRIDFIADLSDRDRREVILGGRTSFGINVAYDVCRRTMKIVKTSFSR